MSVAEEEQYLPTKAKHKKKTRMIAQSSASGNFFYSLIYQLAAQIYDRMDAHRIVTFPQLPKTSSKTATIHKIGQWVAKKRIRYDRADIHNIGNEVGFMDLIQSPEYEDRAHFFVLTQAAMWEYVFSIYGVKGEQKLITVHDKVRVAGIVFLEDMRPFIEDMIGTSRASSVRAVLDAAPARKLYAMNRLHEKFIDREVVIHVPPNWENVENMMSVNEINGDGAFEKFGHFNPNNPARISLPWTPADVSAIFAKVLAEYNTAMEKYTKGTGGGSGSHAIFAVWDEAQLEQHKQWKERSVGWIAQYAGQMSMLYLGVVLMWDAEFGYKFHARKDPTPDDCMIDDNFAPTNSDDNNDEQFRTPTATSLGTNGGTTGRSTVSTSSGLKKTSSKHGVESLLNEIQAGRTLMQSKQDEMVQMLKAATTATTAVDSLVSNISDTLNVITGCKKELSELVK